MTTVLHLGAVSRFFTERRHFKQNMPRIVNQINDAGYGDVAQVVSDGQLLHYQKAALITAARNMVCRGPLFALAQNQIAQARASANAAWPGPTPFPRSRRFWALWAR